MSTQGAIRRNWFDAEVYTETRYYDGDPSQTVRSATARVGPLLLRFNRWPGDAVTHRRDWRVFRNSGYLMGRTPWGNWDVETDSYEFCRVEESGDVPMPTGAPMTTTGTELPVPDEALAEFARTHGLPDPRHTLGNGGVEWEAVKQDVRAISSPVVTAVLLALMDAVGDTLHGNDGPVYRDGYDAAIGAVRELLADRLDELGVKVEDQ